MDAYYAHEQFRRLAMRLDAEGCEPDAIVGALLALGIENGCRHAGGAFVARYLEKSAAWIRADLAAAEAGAVELLDARPAGRA